MTDTQEFIRKASIRRWVLLGFALLLTVIWLFFTPGGLLGKADAVGYAVCHRIDARSFHMGERAMPLCARCSGLFLGAFLGLFYQIAQGRRGKMPPVLVMILFGTLALAWVIDGVNSFLMLTPLISAFYQTQNWTRLVTGTGMGLAISAILTPAFIQTMFRRWKASSAFGDWKQVLGLFLGAAVLDVLILLQIPLILVPLSLISAGSVLILLMMIYCMVWVMVFKKENTFDRLSQLFVPLLGGYITAVLQIGAFDLARYLLTGTWGGFVLF